MNARLRPRKNPNEQTAANQLVALHCEPFIPTVCLSKWHTTEGTQQWNVMVREEKKMDYLDDWVRLDPRTTTEAAAAVGAVHARRTTNPPSLSIPLLLLLLDNCYDDGDAAVVAPFATAVRRTMKPNC